MGLLLKIWGFLNGNKRNLGIVLYAGSQIVPNPAVRIPLESLAASLAGVGVVHAIFKDSK